MSIIELHKKYHTNFLIAESILLCLISFGIASLGVKENYVLNVEGEYEYYSSSFVYNMGYAVNYIPFILNVLMICFILSVVFIRDKKKDPIKAKKICKYVFYASVGVCVINLVLNFLLIKYQVNSAYIIYVYDFSWARRACFICALLLSADTYVWRSEFGLEKFYGNGNDIYR